VGGRRVLSRVPTRPNRAARSRAVCLWDVIRADATSETRRARRARSPNARVRPTQIEIGMSVVERSRR
jgi:hypothetical protein